MSDIGLTHIALPVTNMEMSMTFYATYARMQVVHRRTDPDGSEVVWLSDRTRPFVIVLIKVAQVEFPLRSFAHLGVGCETREEVDRLCEQAREDGCLRMGPTDSGYPIGYWAFLADPDGQTLEIAFGQEVALKVAQPEQIESRRPG